MSSLLLPCLAADLARDLSPALAPASSFHSCADLLLPKPEASDLRCLAHSLGRGFRPFTGQNSRGLGAFAVSATLSIGQVLSLSGVTASLRSLGLADLPLAEASCKPSPDRRVDRCYRHPRDQNSGNFKALRLSVPVASCPEDKLKVRLKRRSGNIMPAEFSTSGQLACGHGWISQRLVAFLASRVTQRGWGGRQAFVLRASDRRIHQSDSLFPLGKSACQASRLRRASRRRRNPFSLMKPSASFWS
jgi:hypothetical protein